MSAVAARGRLNPLHRLWRAFPARERRALLARGTALLAPRPAATPLDPGGGLIVAGELSRASGLGEVARLMLAGAAQLGVPCWKLDTGTAIDTRSVSLPADAPASAPLLIHVNAPFLPLALLKLPRRLLGKRRVIGYWAWELPVAPEGWRAGVPFVHEAWVLSHFTAAAIEPLLPGRVRVVTPPVAAAPPAPSSLGRADFGLPPDSVVVLASFSLASSFARKNPLGAIAAFRAAFGDRPDRLLVLKVGNPGDFPAEFRVIAQAVAGAANIRLETRTLPAADSHALTAAADIILSLHRSEGFGLVPAEAMLLGRAVVATGWSGNMDFMTAENAVPVGYRLVPAADPRAVFEAEGAVWAEPDLQEAAEALRRLADDRQLRVALGGAAREAAARRLGAGSLRDGLRALRLL
ncbi:MAG: glycosyltransferase family 4 protein [Acetobacteraceae bacterium]|nr:glycosyltransferase family 4 protein [Acetobacteraceae bacterium]